MPIGSDGGGRARVLLALLSLFVACTPKIDTEDAYALCDWIEANDPVDCSVEECVTVLCHGDNVDAGDCEPIVEASEEGIEKINELSHRGLPGTLCYDGFALGDQCADRFVECREDNYFF